MRTLYHFPLSVPSRTVRLVLAEKKLEFILELERPWERRTEFLAMNHAGEVPVLVEPDGSVLAEPAAICEYLDEVHREPPLLGGNPKIRAEVRRLMGWFDRKFDLEVTRNLVGEKIGRRMSGHGHPDSRLVRLGYAAIHDHMEYITWLSERRKWLAGDSFSLADITAAAHLSALDYINDVPWDEHPAAKDWYARIKSRPSFRPLLADRIAGINPPKHYDNLDF